MPYAACVSGRSSSGTRVQGERKKRGQRSLELRAEVFQPKGAEDSCIAAAFSMPSMSRIPPAIRFELPGRCNKRSERNTSSISEQTLETPLQETPRMTLSEERPHRILASRCKRPAEVKNKACSRFPAGRNHVLEVSGGQLRLPDALTVPEGPPGAVSSLGLL